MFCKIELYRCCSLWKIVHIYCFVLRRVLIIYCCTIAFICFVSVIYSRKYRVFLDGMDSSVQSLYCVSTAHG